MKIFLEVVSIIVFAILLSFSTWFWSPENVVKVQYCLPIAMILLAVLYGTIRYIVYLHEKIKMQTLLILPKLKTTQHGRLIFEPSELFSTHTVVSLFYKDIGEQFIGWGYVETVLTDTKFLQVVIKQYFADWTNDKVFDKKTNIIIKPSLPLDSLETSQRQGDIHGI